MASEIVTASTPGSRLQCIVEATQEFTAGAGVIFPGIFAIQNDRDDGISSLRKNRLRGLLDIVHEVRGGVRGGHSRVHKANQIRDGVVAEDQVHLGLRRSRSDEWCKASRAFVRAGLIPKVRPSTPSSVAIQFTPRLWAMVRTSSETLPSEGHTPTRANTEDLLVEIEAAQKLLAGILRMTKTVLRQGQAGRGNAAHIGVADQRKNRVIERRSRELDSTLLGGLGVGGQNPAQSSSRSRAITRR